MAGAIHFIPKKYLAPEFTFTLSDTDESSLPWKKGSLAHNSLQIASPIVKNDDHFLQASFFSESDDGKFPFQTQSASGVRDFNAQNQTRWVMGGKSQFKDLTLQYDALYGKQIKQSPGPTNFFLPTREDSEGFLASLSPHLFLSEKHSLRSKLSYLDYKSMFLENGIQTETKQRTFIAQNEWIYDISAKTQLQVFGDFFSHNMDNSFSGNGLQQNQFEFAPFFKFFSNSNWQHQVGGRYLSFSEKLLPTASTTYFFSDHKVWVSYVQGFRNPSLSDLYSKSPYFMGNRNLQPEQSEQIEVGLAKTFYSQHVGWLYDIRLFHMNYRNFIESAQLTPGVFSQFNQGTGRSRGLDVDVSWNSPRLVSSISYNFLDTKNHSTGYVFRLSPKHQLNISLLYKMDPLQFEVQNTHWYDYYDLSFNQNVRLDDWQQWNFLIHLVNNTHSRISLGLVNAFNEGKELTVFYPEPQRKYWLQWNYSFTEIL